MTKTLFNSSFENSLRIILLLCEFEKAQSLDMIYTADFLISYGADFGFGEFDLNGDNPYKYSEFPSRRVIVQEALKELVLDGLVLPICTDSGILYAATQTGKAYGDALQSDYANEYREIAFAVTKKVSTGSIRDIIGHINKMSMASLRKGV